MALPRTIVPSPARLLREKYPLGGGPRAGSWQKIGDGTPLACGLRVYDVADERHIGLIEGYEFGFARVRWEETRWLSEVRYRDLRKAEDA